MLQSYSLPAAICRVLLALTGWVILVLQFVLAHSTGKAIGQTMGMTTANFFSYFTILTNFLVAFSLTMSMFSSQSRVGAFFSRATVQTAIAGYMLVVGCVYNVVLAKLINLHGSAWIADFFLHTLLPLFYLGYWVLFVPKGSLWLSAPLAWLMYPLLYLVYSLIRGFFLGWYPYPFLDVVNLGYGLVIRNSIIVLGCFLLFFYALILGDKAMGRRIRPTPQS